MVLDIIVILAVLVIVYFHYLHGFFSATLSAILAAVSAVIAFAYHETVVEKLLGGAMADQAHAMMLVAIFAVTYLILRVLFDKLVPGNLRMPATLDKIGGAVMGVVAAAFAVGIVAIAAQQLPFSASIGGKTRYATREDREVRLPTKARQQDRWVVDELEGDRFSDENLTKLWLPVDDLVVGTVAHLSGGGSLAADRPLTDVHPDYLQELFGQRVGIQVGAQHTALNLGNKEAVNVQAVFKVDKIAQVIDHEFKLIRQGEPKPPVAGGSEALLVVRLGFKPEAAPEKKDGLIRFSPGSVRLVTPAPGGETVNNYPIGTIDNTGRMYAHKPDDYLFVDSKVAGGTADLVYRVPAAALTGTGTKQQLAAGTFLEFKRLARVDLGGKLLGAGQDGRPVGQTPVADAVLRKDFAMERPAGAPTPTPVPTVTPADELKQKLAGSWRGNSENGTENYTFNADGSYSGSVVLATGQTIPAQGKWDATGADGKTLSMTLRREGGNPIELKWRFTDDNAVTRITASGKETQFNRTG